MVHLKRLENFQCRRGAQQVKDQRRNAGQQSCVAVTTVTDSSDLQALRSIWEDVLPHC